MRYPPQRPPSPLVIAAPRAPRLPILALLALIAASAAAVWPIAIGAQPGALRVSAGGPYAGGVDEAILFRAEIDLGGRPPGTEVEVLWDFGDGSTGVGPEASHAYTRAGTFTVTVTARVGQDVVMDTTSATIQAATQPGQLTVDAGGPYSGRVGQPVTFEARVGLGGRPPGTEVAVSWEFGDGDTGLGQSTTHIYTAPGTYTVRVVASVGPGQTAEDTTTATIAAEQQISGSAGGPYAGSVGQPVTMTASISPSGLAVAEWNWDFGDGTTGSGQTVQKTYTATGTYTVTVEIRPANEGAVTATTTATISAQAQTEPVRLVTGCNNVALTWPVGTPLMSVVNAVAPPGVVESLFTLDATQGRFRGYSPSAPSFANDFTMIETPLQAVYVCVAASSTLNRPVP